MALYTNIKGPINYTNVGSPTIENGIVSNLDTTNYLQLNQIPIIKNSIEINIEYIIKSKQSSTWSSIFYTSPTWIFAIQFINNRHRITYNGNQYVQLWGINPAIGDRVKINVKVTSSNIIVNFYNYTKGTSATSTSDVQIDLSSLEMNYKLGASIDLESIDLNNTYINIDGNAWFGTSFSKVKLHSPSAIAYTKVGNPTITADGIASGFTDKNDYLTLGAFNPGTSKWKFTTKVKIYDYTTQISLIDRNSSTRCFQIVVRTTGKFRVNISTNGSSKANEVDGTHVLSVNTIYYICFEYDGNKYYLKYSLDNINWTTDITINNSTKIYPVSSMCMGHSWYGSGTEKWNGEIYLRWTRFEIDGVTNDKYKLHCLEGN